MISYIKNLYVGDFFSQPKELYSKKELKIVSSSSRNLVLDGMVLEPFVYDLKAETSILVSRDNHLKPLSHYVNWLGLPKKKIPAYEKERQQQVLTEIKELKKLRRI